MMNVRELLHRLIDHATDGKGATEPVLIRCDGHLREVASVETRIAEQPNGLFVLVVADGPSAVVAESAITPRAPRE